MKLQNKSRASFAATVYNKNYLGVSTPWIVDKLKFNDHDVYSQIVEDCRFYFRYDPMAYTIITKIVDLAINDLVIIPDKKSSPTEVAAFDSLKNIITPFIKEAALEYLITGMVIPVIEFSRLSKTQQFYLGIPNYTSLQFPSNMWIRDSSTIEIKDSLVSGKKDYFIKVPSDLIFFIQNKGIYTDGTKDLETYDNLVKNYPDFVAKVLNGETSIKLDNPLVVRHITLKDSPYPVPYLYPALESMKHKRQLRKMDYSIISRVIAAILHVKVGNDEFPLTEDDGDDVLADLEAKFKWRDNLSINEVEKVFTLFTNHVVDMQWIFPDIDTLVSNEKYQTVNSDILIALGFPRILVTGETERYFTSDPNIATLSPIQTMNAIRNNLLKIVRYIFVKFYEKNKSIKTLPQIKWKPINLYSAQMFINGIIKLYESGNLSRESFSHAFGYELREELLKRLEEQKFIEETGLQEFMPLPFSPNPDNREKIGED